METEARIKAYTLTSEWVPRGARMQLNLELVLTGTAEENGKFLAVVYALYAEACDIKVAVERRR